MSISSEVLYKSAQWCLIALVFLLPVWFLPTTINPVEFNKVLMVSILVFLSFILFLAYSIKSGNVALPWHPVFIAAGALLLSWLASALISRSGAALWGLGSEPTSFLAMVTFFLMSAMIMLLFSDGRSLTRLITALGLGLLLFLLTTLVFDVFGLGQNLGGLFQSRIFNAVGSWNSVGFAAAFFLMMLYPFLRIYSGAMKWAVAISFLLSSLLILVVNFPLIWGVVGFFAILLLSHAIWKKNISLSAVGIPLGLLLISLFALFFSNFIASAITFPAPVEVGVTHQTTFNVVSKALRENLVFGAGPTSFGYLWDKYRPPEINNTPFWGLRFVSGSSLMLSALGEAGLLGWLAFVIFLGWIWYLGLKTLTKNSGENSEVLVFTAFLLFSFTILMWSLYAVGYVLAALGFVALGLMLAAMRHAGVFKTYEFSLVREGPRGFISALAVVFFIILGVLGTYTVVRRYVGQLAYARGLEATNRGNLDDAEKQLILAVQADIRNDLYLRSLAQIYMSKAQVLSQDKTTPPDILGSRFKDFFDRAVSTAQEAIRQEPLDFLNYRTLGQIYGFLVQLNAAGSMDAAQIQYDEALKRAPTSPLLWRDKAITYLADFSLKKNRDSLKKAEEALLKTVALKPDYAEGHFLLAQVYDAEGQAAEAIRRGEAAALLVPKDIGALFQLGLLYYRANRLSDAEVVFKSSVEISPNYSNARYFLGLIYDKLGRSTEAISEFQKISALNPDNDEVKKIIVNLKLSKTALAGIAPPGQAPEKRKETPVKER
ncbi:hypothetical protein A3B05_02630 [Candidatus Giovannonibacteria bacterium RIFCSPLOWO2_01_FULL_43_160]|uniref:Uncharacterized protein n=2 Tax=Candidatus Giovannoniibacteriota TaxID=1752738 RepID=A0A0G1LT54_9BACT|nr:MAG: hypothetical protein UV72_C0006G0013 [Candidatus Giovannonibacteria bacterium GW2011_GWB1_43_13]KKS99397.1 MAG: hypothetical protein UV75_C0005G0014 [Candidatus Giovannonibacteria bacterium GW2011_GWA1_43_15]KKT21775.1 MAG: hypothetical protein UW05_C0003G0011 [Candidatus Giovannonibacteria bacterium GW2011_GWC2_43_8]KKT62934.1 MAG: hypothetical protein UW55_C0008G0015 [Candidatus Giovannonibacteria bacterium GW2011_GWA2_44_26]OGF58741.1 MAG: hypothetical protein A2652_00650 [Candidatus